MPSDKEKYKLPLNISKLENSFSLKFSIVLKLSISIEVVCIKSSFWSMTTVWHKSVTLSFPEDKIAGKIENFSIFLIIFISFGLKYAISSTSSSKKSNLTGCFSVTANTSKMSPRKANSPSFSTRSTLS